MLQISNLTDNANQQTTSLLSDNSSVVFSFRFLPVVQRWVMDISYGDFAIKGMNLCIHPNLLRTFRQRIPFGLACVAPDGVDPFDINDFINGRILLFILDNSGGGTEVEEVEANYFT